MTNEISPAPEHNEKEKFDLANFIFFLPFQIYKRIILFISSMLLIIFIAFSLRAFFPMDLPEAKDITYAQMIGRRWASIRDNGGNMVKVTTLMIVYQDFFILSSGLFTFDEAYLESKLANWTTSTFISPEEYDRLKPQNTDVSLKNLPLNLWESYEKISWSVLGKANGSLPDITFPNKKD